MLIGFLVTPWPFICGSKPQEDRTLHILYNLFGASLHQTATSSLMIRIHDNTMQSLHVLIITLLFLFVYSLHQFPFAHALSSSIPTNTSLLQYPAINLSGNSSARLFLQSRSSDTLASFGFYSTDGSVFILCVMMSYYGGYGDSIIGHPQVIWSANRNFPVGRDDILSFTGAGQLILQNNVGTFVWSTPTKDASVVGMRLDGSGNLVLFDQNNVSVWESFDYPTDTLVIGQLLCVGANLTANDSFTSWASGQINLHTSSNGLQFYFGSAAYTQVFQPTSLGNGTSDCYAFTNGSFGFPKLVFSLPLARSFQFMRLEFDGHFRLYEMKEAAFHVVFDVLSNEIKFCDYPLACGEYSVCINGQCCCPSSHYFRLQDEWRPDMGCLPWTNLSSCNDMRYHQLVPISNISYFSDDAFQSLATSATDADCKQSCLEECSCKVALFQYDDHDGITGSCLHLSQASLLSQTTNSSHRTSVFFKIQGTMKRRTNIAIGSAVGSFALFATAISIFTWRKCKKTEEEECFLGGIPGVPARFSYNELKIATRNFSMRLGSGGFGSVFKGKIGKETIAVKRLEGVDQGKQEFLAEVETIGRIHHINLVRLIGFCAEKSSRLLVYEYMSNSSLDKWIFHAHPVFTLSWKTRCNIIMGIAKGLSYLHEECEQRIAHLDIKPQNILLDDRFNAKVSDFGLSKLISRDDSKIMTRMRGTRGYLAPEWLGSKITEKVDIYSFGIVIVEIICGRRNLDESQPEERVHLISLLQEKARCGKLFDLVDTSSNDMQFHMEEVREMMELAMWCLQVDSSKRPLMSTVAKVLEGAMTLEATPHYDLVANHEPNQSDVEMQICSYLPSATHLSGPR
ncbi:G-type lectin S-receptor-like serine/threonine-protein kinase SD2-5 [Triticum dicoccoides]|uniref:G-type lectin S-receptor-like serine/threonine-protein kinase SD2-5 n=1 Tax=Triticum dicoccoides TaxID=85692 RepID=UPI00189045C9|nr:G-type lectin S-receptor-like serine/threonine-protein kinase SD2-5 [Triticum dicoccoides]